jgi:hypothetical protein
MWSFGIFCGHFGIFYSHLVYFVDIWYILWTFGIFCGHLVYLSSFGRLHQEKSGNRGSIEAFLRSVYTNNDFCVA